MVSVDKLFKGKYYLSGDIHNPKNRE